MSTVLDAPISLKRRAILDAAGELFLRHGFAAVSMDAVAREAEVSKATLYAHFEGKEALFTAIVAERCAAMAAEAKGLASHDDAPGEGLARIGRLYLDFLLRPETLAMHRMVVAEGARMKVLAEAFDQAGPLATRRWLAGWIAEEQARGRLRTDAAPEEAASVFSALLRAEVHFRAALGLDPTPDAARIEAAVTLAVDVFLRAYGA